MPTALPAGADSSVAAAARNFLDAFEAVSMTCNGRTWVLANAVCSYLAWREKVVCGTSDSTFLALVSALKEPLQINAANTAALAVFDQMATDAEAATGAGERAAVTAIIVAARAAIVTALG